MQIELGYGPTPYGTVETTPQGLHYAGTQPQTVKNLVESMRQPGQNDTDLLTSLPKRLTSRVWAKVVG
jgi:hypothetical protein